MLHQTSSLSEHTFEHFFGLSVTWTKGIVDSNMYTSYKTKNLNIIVIKTEYLHCVAIL